MVVTYDQFVQWKHHVVTRALVEEIEKTIAELATEILERPENNPNRDQYVKGFIRGLVTTRDFQPDIVKEELVQQEEEEEIDPNE